MTAAPAGATPRRGRRVGVGFALVAAALLTLTAAPAGAAYPGANGLLVYQEVIDCHYEEDGLEGYCISALYTRTAAGESPKKLLSTRQGVNDPTWSADGRRVVYIRPNNGHIWIINADGSGHRRVTRTSDFRRHNPTFSPSGRRILFETFVTNTRRAAVSVKLDGSGRRVIARFSGGDIANPVYSPDGRRIAFEYWPDNAKDPYRSGIYTARSDGTGLRRVTAASNYDRNPTWSPDGRWLAFSRQKPGDIQVYKVRSDGTRLDRLTSIAKNAINPAWSPDGRRILYVAERYDLNQLWSMRPDGSDKQLIYGSDRYPDEPDWQPLP